MGKFIGWRIAGLALGLAPYLQGQNVLYVKDGEHLTQVVAAEGNRPLVEKGGKLVGADTQGYYLQKVPEYLPVLVLVQDLDVTEVHQDAEGGDRDFHFYFAAKFESAFALDDVFIVLDLAGSKAGRHIFLQEIGNLSARKTQKISLNLRMIGGMGEGSKYKLHVFSHGQEVLNSNMPWEYREHVLDEMVARRTTGQPDRPPQPFFGPAPAYPASLVGAKISGRAVVGFTIGTRGQVVDPRVVSATDPAFGAAALEAIRTWRFLPRISHGHPADTPVNFPFGFSP